MTNDKNQLHFSPAYFAWCDSLKSLIRFVASWFLIDFEIFYLLSWFHQPGLCRVADAVYNEQGHGYQSNRGKSEDRGSSCETKKIIESLWFLFLFSNLFFIVGDNYRYTWNSPPQSPLYTCISSPPKCHFSGHIQHQRRTLSCHCMARERLWANRNSP